MMNTQTTGAREICPECYFSVNSGDLWCAGCGASLQKLAVEPETLDFFLPPGGTGRAMVRLRNEGVLTASVEKIQFQGVQADFTEGFGAITIPRGEHLDREIKVKPAGVAEGVMVGSCGGRRLEIPMRVHATPAIYPVDTQHGPLAKRSRGFVLQAASEGGQVTASIGLSTDTELNLVLEDLVLPDTGGSVIAPRFLAGQAPLRDQTIEFDIPVGEEGEVALKIGVKCVGLKQVDMPILLDTTERPNLVPDPGGRFVDERVVTGLGIVQERELEIRNDGKRTLSLDHMRVEEPWVDVVGFHQVELGGGESYRCNLQLHNDKCEACASAGEGKAGELQIKLNLKLDLRYGSRLQHATTWDRQIGLITHKAERLAMPLAIDFGTTNTCLGYYGERLTKEKRKEGKDYYDDFPRGYTPPRDDWGPQMHDLDVKDDEGFEFPTFIQFRHFSAVDGFSVTSSEKQSEELALFGETAKGYLVLGLSYFIRTAWGFKPRIGSGDPFWLRDIGEENNLARKFSAEDLTRIYLTEVFRRFQQQVNRRVTRIIATFPTTFRRKEVETYRNILSEVTGLSVDEKKRQIFTEVDEAAALSLGRACEFLGEGASAGEAVLEDGQEYFIGVFDCGGGTTDLNIARIRRRGEQLFYKRLCTEGLTKGGEHLTFLLSRLLFDYIRQSATSGQPIFQDAELASLKLKREDLRPALMGLRFPQRAPWEIYGGDYQDWEQDNFRHLFTAAERMKTRYSKYFGDDLKEPNKPSIAGLNLSPENEVSVFEVPLAKTVVDRCIEQFTEQGLHHLEEMCRRSGLQKRPGIGYLDEVLLCGNSSKLPVLERVVRRKYGDRVRFDPLRGKIGVVEGALDAYRYVNDGDLIIETNGIGGPDGLEWPLGFVKADRFRQLFKAGSPWTGHAMVSMGGRYIGRNNSRIDLKWQRSMVGDTSDPSRYPVAGHVDLSDFENNQLELSFYIRDGEVVCRVTPEGGGGPFDISWVPREDSL